MFLFKVFMNLSIIEYYSLLIFNRVAESQSIEHILIRFSTNFNNKSITNISQ